MAQIYNAGNDFVAAFSEGARQRMAREQFKAQQLQQIEDNKFKGEQLKLEHARLDQESAAQQAQIAAHFESVKHQRMADIANGLIKVDPNDPNTQMNPDAPGAKNVQIGALDQLNNLPPQLRDHIMAAFSGQQQQPNYNYDVNAAVNPQQSPLAANPSLFTQSQQAPQPPASSITETQPDPQTFSPSSTQYSDIDPRLNNGNPYMKLTGLTTPEDQQKLSMQQMLVKAKMDALTEGMKANAKLPAEKALEEAKNQGALKVQDSKNQNALTVEDKKTQAAKELAASNQRVAIQRTLLTERGRIEAANIAANARKYATDNAKKTGGLDPEVITDNAVLAATGHANFPSYTNNGMAVTASLKKSGMVPFDPKNAEKLAAVNDVNVLYDTMSDAVEKLPSNAVSALFDKAAQRIPNTDAYNLHAAVFGKAANISHTYGGEIGRLSDPDVNRAMGTLVDSGITKDEAKRRLNVMKLESSSKVLDHILSGVPDKQKLMILQDRNFDPTKFIVRGKNGSAVMLPNGSPMPKFAQKDNSWWSYNEKTGQYDQVK